MKNSLNLDTSEFSMLTVEQLIILIGFIILPAAILILIFSLLGQLIIQRLTKAKISKTFGSLITQKELEKQLYEGKHTYRDEEQDRDTGVYSPNINKRSESSEDFIFWEQQNN